MPAARISASVFIPVLHFGERLAGWRARGRGFGCFQNPAGKTTPAAFFSDGPAAVAVALGRSFKTDAGLTLIVERTVKTAGVQIDQHGGYRLSYGYGEVLRASAITSDSIHAIIPKNTNDNERIGYYSLNGTPATDQVRLVWRAAIKNPRFRSGGLRSCVSRG